MKFLKALRLLLDIYGALFLGVMIHGAVFLGVFPYKAFLDLGALVFYAALIACFVFWIALAGYILLPKRNSLSSGAHPPNDSR